MPLQLAAIKWFSAFLPLSLLAIPISARAAATPLSVATAVLSPATVGSSYSATLKASGGAAPYTWSIASGSSAPGGLTLLPSGVLSGVPSTASGIAATTFKVQVVDSAGTAPAVTAVSLVIHANPLRITSTSILPGGLAGTAYARQLTANGGTGAVHWKLASCSSLVPGLTLSSTGSISGTPMGYTSGTGNFTVVATDSASPAHTASQSVSYTVNAPPFKVVTTSLPTGVVASAYPRQLVAAGGVGKVTWSLAAGSQLVKGLALQANGSIVGTPGAATGGRATFSVVVTDSASPSRELTAEIAYTIQAWAATPVFTPQAGTYTSAQRVTIADATPDPAIFYTTDGSAPTMASTRYTGSIRVSANETLQAVAYSTGYALSAVATATYIITPPAAAPQFTPGAGTYTSAPAVQVTDSTPGAAIYYTTNGATPTTASSVYNGPIAISANETLEAMALAPQFSQSPIATATYTIAPPAATPVFSIAPGTYIDAPTVSITGATANSTIYYTTNSTVPTTASAIYTGAITVSSTETLEAIAIAPQYSLSAIASAAYTITPPAATPVFSVAPGTYISSQTVSISDATANSTIYYTTNGIAPTTASSVYIGPIAVPATETVEAIALAPRFSQSATACATYTIAPPAATPVFSVAPGTYVNAQTVTFTDATANSTIYYTTNGTAPTAASSVYSGPIAVSATETLEAIALAPQFSPSSVATAVYTIMPPAATPVFSVAPGTYINPQTVTIAGATANSTIYFTTNGVPPTVLSSIYAGPITVPATETIEAIALAPQFSQSAAASALYTIAPPAATPVFSVAPGTYMTAQTVAITGATANSTIFYTVNGAAPTTASSIYNSPITVSSTETLEAIALAPQFSQSAVATATYTIAPMAATPVFSVAPGTYFNKQTVTISDATPNSTIYFTVNGTAPTTASSIYTSPIAVSATETLEALALAPQYSLSSIATAVYTIAPPAAKPVFSVAPGTYFSTQTVAITGATANCTIYFTVNGTTPTTASSVYTGPITVSSTKMLEAIAIAPQNSLSPVATAIYTITPPAATPVFSVAPGTYMSTQTVTITDATANSTIYFTTNGVAPTTAPRIYAGPIAVATTETLNAMALAPQYSQSAVAAATYTITPPAATPVFSAAPGTYINTQTVTIADATANSTIYFTANGAAPTVSSSVYAGPITVSSTETLEAMALAPQYSQSAVAAVTYTITPTASTPVFSVAPGTYINAQIVSIADATASSTIYYTTNGTAPTAGSSIYTGPITVSANATLEAMALTPQYSQSAIASAAYTITPPTAAPVFSVAPGTYVNAQAVAITGATPNSTVYFTTNGATPAAGSNVYTGPITVSATETLEAIAIAPQYSVSPVTTAAYTITPPAATPIFSLASGTYISTQSVTITGATANSTIYFTTNGAAPTTASSVYNGPIAVSATATLEAMALAPQYSPSATATATYTITPPAATPVFDVAPGTYTNTQTVIITGATVNSTIYYTTNGTPPTSASSTYNGPITVSATMIVEAIAMAPQYSPSTVAVATYTITPPAATPVFSVAPGTYINTQTVTITGATANSTIYVTTNGTTPTTTSNIFTGPIAVSATETIQAMALAPQYSQSAIASAAYTITPPAATPVFSVAPGTYIDTQIVTVADATANSTIYFTTNGAAPTSASIIYTGPITVSSTETLEAVALAPQHSLSGIATGLYTITPPAASPLFSVAPGTYINAQTVTITCATASSTIYYTTNGTAPTTASNVYTGPIAVSSTETIGAIALAPQYSQSAIATANYTITPPAAAPVFGVAAGTYTNAQTVTISGATANSTIYVTANGTTPTTASSVYSGPIIVSATETLQAMALAPQYSQSAIASALYTITPPAATPVFSVAPGTYVNAQTVTISSFTANSTIYYTINGTAPTTLSIVYTGPIPVSTTETIEAIAIAPQFSQSTVASALYTITPPAAMPAFSVAPGTYINSQTVSITDATPSATIYYTANGATPTTVSSIYSGPIAVSASETLEAMALAPQYSQSAIASALYTITPPAATPVLSVAPGTYINAQTVAITDSTANSTIYFTTNGIAPTTASSVFTGPITVSATQTLEAMALAPQYSQSAMASALYTITPPTATPVFSIAPGAYINAQTVTITDATVNSIIYFTVNGTPPATASNVYNGPITISATETVEAIAIAPQYSQSALATANYTITPPAATPVFSIAPGTYVNSQTVTITSATTNSTIYYTTNSATPTTASSVYLGPIAVSATETLEAIALAPLYSQSAVAAATYTITPPAATPAFGVASGTYINAQTVSLTDATANATIYFTINGTIPTSASSVYVGPIAVSTTETLEAIALAPQFSPSAAATATYTITPPAATPVFSVASGTYINTQTVTITGATANSTIYYTTNGNTPSVSSSVFAGPIAVSTTETLEAMALAPNYSQSAVAVATYTVTPPSATPVVGVAPGTYLSSQTVTITDATVNAVIYFTINGTTPTTASSVYSGPITVTTTETLEAIALAPQFSQSAVVTALYTIKPPAATPVFGVASGTYVNAQTVAITGATANCVIYYTKNGSPPSASSSVYTGPITVSATETLEAMALAPQYSQSAVATATYTITPPAATPVFSVAPGTYIKTQAVTITGATANSTIYVTTDGTAPTAASSVYNGPITVSSTETIGAMALAPQYSPSAIATATYTIMPPTAAPMFSVAPGTYINTQTVSLTDATSNASIYFTTDGTVPTISSNLYNGPITVSATETIQAIALAPQYSQSAIAEAAYIITPPAATPAFSAAPGTYGGAQTVSITCATAASVIYYTINGTTPTTASSVYIGPIAVPATETLEAIAVAPLYSQSAVAVAPYVVLPTLIIATPANLPPAFVGAPYCAAITVSGGGSEYTWTVNSAAVSANGALVTLPMGITFSSTGGYVLAMSGTPTVAGPVTIQVAVSDNASGDSAGPITFSLAVNTPVSVSLPAPTPISVGPAIARESYTGYLGVSGGVPPYTWTVTGLPGNLTWFGSTGISTVAGNGSAGYSGDGGPAASAQIDNMGGMAVDPAGNIYFADQSSARVREVTPAGVISTVAGTGVAGYNGDNIAASTAQLNAPVGLAVDLAGDLYIADAGNGRIRLVTAATGNISTVAGTGSPGYNGDNIPSTSAELNWPAGLAVDNTGNLYIADSGNRRIREVAATTGMIATVAGTGTGGFTGDGGPAVQAQLNNPNAIAVDAVGNIYIADLTGNAGLPAAGGRIRKVTAANALIATVAGQGTAGYNGDGIAATNAELNYPAGLAVDGNGNLYIADAGNNRIRAVASATNMDTIATLAGTGNSAYNGDNIPAAFANIDNPQSVAADSAGNIYIADQNGRIREIQTPAADSELIIGGTPSAAGMASFQVSVQDATGSMAGPVTYAFNITAPQPVSLPPSNPGSLGAAIAGQSYSGSIVAFGGVPNFTWTVNRTQLSPGGKPVALSDGLNVSTTGSNALFIGGTPTSTGVVAFQVSVQDAMSTKGGPVTYSIDVVSGPGYTVSGQIGFANCGPAGVNGVTVSINTIPAQVTSTGSNGQFSFQNVANGTYTVTPTIAGASSIFYPANQSVTVNGASAGGIAFSASLGYTVSGTVSYAGSSGGRIYLELINDSCGGSPLGTSISAGQFNIQGVQPGTYTLQAWKDNLGYGAPNASNPVGVTSNVTVSSANLTAVPVTLADPAPVVLSAPPGIAWAGPFTQGVMLGYNAIEGSNEQEQAASYTVQWSASASFSTIAGSSNFPATGGMDGSVWFLNGLAKNAIYYFRVQGVAGNSLSSWSPVFGPVTIAAPTAGNKVSGAVSFTSSIDNGALYVGFYNPATGNAYVSKAATYAVNPQAYSVYVPTGSNYVPFALIDQNQDGLADWGDLNGMNGNAPIAVSGNTIANLTIPAGASATLTTHHLRQTNQGGFTDSYNLNFLVDSPNLQLWWVVLSSGPNVLVPMSIGDCTSCGNNPFSFWVSTGNAVPNVGDSYGMVYMFGPGGLAETITAQVGAVSNAFATSLSPTTGSTNSVTPAFTWTDPANAGSYTYQFTLWDSNGNTIWQIPAANSGLNGFSSSITSINWGTDPTGENNQPTVSSLSSAMTYYWSIQAVDSTGNSAQMEASYNP